MAQPILNQIRKSTLSKHGQTSTTGIFESQPENEINNQRGFTTPSTNPVQVPRPIDLLYKDSNTMTYLDSLKIAKQI